MFDQLLEQVRRFLQKQELLRPDALILAAVSGGPDSLCLLHLLVRLRAEGGPQLHLAHLDHGLRPAAADEAAQVRALAASWNVPATVERRSVQRVSGAAGLMDAARRVRYAFLAETALATGAQAVAVAQQADDQAETVLLHLLRGAGLQGLRGMRELVSWEEWAGGHEQGLARPLAPSRSRPLLRPFLTTPRAAIEAYCVAHGLTPTRDPSNQDERFARVRIRRLLGELAAENPRIVEALGRSAAALGDDYAFIQGELDVRWPQLAVEREGLVALQRASFLALHPALQRHAMRRAVARLSAQEPSFAQLEGARHLATLPGHHMRLAASLWLAVDQRYLSIIDAPFPPVALPPPLPGSPDAPQLPAATLPLPTSGAVELGHGWICVVGEAEPTTPVEWRIGLDPASLDGPLMLRRRRPGERFRPVGGRGSRKLQDLFVDRKVPHALRAAWPILVAGERILWVPGLRASEGAAATDKTPGTIWVALVRG